MNAYKFVEVNGLERAKQEQLDRALDGLLHDFDWELKQAIADFELVESLGGLNGARNTLKLLRSSIEIGLDHGMNVNAVVEIPKLEQAIQRIEQGRK